MLHDLILFTFKKKHEILQLINNLEGASGLTLIKLVGFIYIHKMYIKVQSNYSVQQVNSLCCGRVKSSMGMQWTKINFACNTKNKSTISNKIIFVMPKNKFRSGFQLIISQVIHSLINSMTAGL